MVQRSNAPQSDSDPKGCTKVQAVFKLTVETANAQNVICCRNRGCVCLMTSVDSPSQTSPIVCTPVKHHVNHRMAQLFVIIWDSSG